MVWQQSGIVGFWQNMWSGSFSPEFYLFFIINIFMNPSKSYTNATLDIQAVIHDFLPNLSERTHMYPDVSNKDLCTCKTAPGSLSDGQGLFPNMPINRASPHCTMGESNTRTAFKGHIYNNVYMEYLNL